MHRVELAGCPCFRASRGSFYLLVGRVLVKSRAALHDVKRTGGPHGLPVAALCQGREHETLRIDGLPESAFGRGTSGDES